MSGNGALKGRVMVCDRTSLSAGHDEGATETTGQSSCFNREQASTHLVSCANALHSSPQHLHRPADRLLRGDK